MISTIIFDFGDVFINLDKKGTINKAKTIFGADIITEKANPKFLNIFKTNNDYEKGLITTSEFISFYKGLNKKLTNGEVIELWNSLIRDFPEYRLKFIEQLNRDEKYNLILLSNTNELHIQQVIENMSFERYKRFKTCFDKFYLSHEIQLRKPNKDIFEFVLNENDLRAEECLFIDDTKENTDSASQLGIHTWHLIPEKDDVINMFKTKNHLF